MKDRAPKWYSFSSEVRLVLFLNDLKISFKKYFDNIKIVMHALTFLCLSILNFLLTHRISSAAQIEYISPKCITCAEIPFFLKPSVCFPNVQICNVCFCAIFLMLEKLKGINIVLKI